MAKKPKPSDFNTSTRWRSYEIDDDLLLAHEKSDVKFELPNSHRSLKDYDGSFERNLLEAPGWIPATDPLSHKEADHPEWSQERCFFQKRRYYDHSKRGEKLRLLERSIAYENASHDRNKQLEMWEEEKEIGSRIARGLHVSRSMQAWYRQHGLAVPSHMRAICSGRWWMKESSGRTIFMQTSSLRTDQNDLDDSDSDMGRTRRTTLRGRPRDPSATIELDDDSVHSASTKDEDKEEEGGSGGEEKRGDDDDYDDDDEGSTVNRIDVNGGRKRMRMQAKKKTCTLQPRNERYRF
ncbi:hypothetical protein K402DRAFT_14236 [Aulographum hederae CBS 113979]|uniref:Uncharacterized protein n=1 Tax=Aulographum hederae CBS 113979 TaxID=1176131 RepID=A0A6G1H808_9PEZI|nr:hypothetical protein K402DRAFT_14236 [Aulographum hederae CBS 113979]